MNARRTAVATAGALAALAGVGLAVVGAEKGVPHSQSDATGTRPSLNSRSGTTSRPEFASVASSATGGRRRALCALPPGDEKLPPGARRGLAHHLNQYPALSLATSTQRAAAERLVATLQETTRVWSDPRRAARAGYVIRKARRPANGSVGILHGEHRRYSHDGRYLDPRRPETLVYANVPGRPLVLIGVMFSMPRRLNGPTPGGPITRWHWHVVCARDGKRGLTPRPDGSCPRGTSLRQGSEMMHVWFTGDLRSAFAIHAPFPDLCAARLVPGGRCRRASMRTPR